ncbi:rna-directed dna polymerase from mobile element jockey-like [Limosa lapponica baueri]|uniref:Rna-directed dna polymerase from mobile element jockey-like n=1 Tax=Limosa lapponica baueri TaxID=1758121 RepID=A0A2I0U6Y4_LIMLA|nr:rna-directed dna polymerase from mobile element jockey-like [Limosa lapponica baueri]
MDFSKGFDTVSHKILTEKLLMYGLGLDDEAECTLSKFADDTKLADILEGHPAIQRDLGRLEKWADRNLMQFNKKCKVLPQGRNNPRHQYTLGITQMENSFAERVLGVLVDTRLNLRIRCLSQKELIIEIIAASSSQRKGDLNVRVIVYANLCLMLKGCNRKSGAHISSHKENRRGGYPD